MFKSIKSSESKKKNKIKSDEDNFSYKLKALINTDQWNEKAILEAELWRENERLSKKLSNLSNERVEHLRFINKEYNTIIKEREKIKLQQKDMRDNK